MLLRCGPYFLAALLLTFSLASAEEEGGGADGASSDEVPAVTKVGEHVYRIGEIRIDAKAREIHLPVVVNMREGGPMEYVLVHEHGKVHESVFVTAVSPLHLQIALKLLKFEDGHGDVFDRLLAPEALAERAGLASERGDEVVFRYRMDDADEPAPVAELITDGESAAPMSDEPWIYTGSTVEGGTFMAEAEGSIIAIYLDHLAMFNMTREGADIDRRWWGNPEAIPEIGAHGTLMISSARNSVTP